MTSKLSTKNDFLIIENACEGDVEEILNLFESAFSETMSPAVWQWKYGSNRGHNVIAKKEDVIVAHYGGIKRHIVWQGKVIPSIQCVDTMVAASGRNTLARLGPYYQVALGFLDQYVGENRPYLFGFGFPNSRVMRLGERLEVQADVGEIRELIWTTKDLSDSYVEINIESLLFKSHLELLWTDMWNKFQGLALCVRDANTLIHRYVSHPTFKYIFKIVLDPKADRPMGAYVLRNEGTSMLLLDVIGAPSMFPYIVDCARSTCLEQGLSTMTAWITRPHIGMLGNKHIQINNPGVRIPTSICTPGPSPSSLKDKWWLMAGDTDFR